jgi:hypothetical protein
MDIKEMDSGQEEGDGHENMHFFLKCGNRDLPTISPIPVATKIKFNLIGLG